MLTQIILEIIYGLLFLFLSLFVFTLPGYGILKRININFEDLLEKYTVSTTFGFVLFTVFAYFLAAIHLKNLIWLFPIFGLVSGYFYKQGLLDFRINLEKKWVKLFLLVLIIGIIAQVAVNAPSGLKFSDGIYFWSSHGHDGIWHLSLMEQMHSNTFPFQNPEFAGHRLQNYHFFVDLLMSEMTRLFHFSNLDVYFRFMPVLFSLLLGLSSYLFVNYWSKSSVAGIWAMFFSYFAGSFGYFLTIPQNHNLSGETIFWVSQTNSVLGNPPHAAAFIIAIVFLLFFLKYLNFRNWQFFWICIFLGGAIIEFKVYAGALLLGGLILIGIYDFLFNKIYQTFLLFLAALFLAVIIYFPNSINSQEFLIWQPWWYIRTMVVAPDRLNWLDLELRRQTYLAEHNLKRVVFLETIAFLIFLFGNLGMRFLGFWEIFRLRKIFFKNAFNLYFLSITLAAFLIPVFFLQKGVAWNTIQFNQYFLLFFGFWAAASIFHLAFYIKTKMLKAILVFIIIILAIPTQLGLLLQFYTNRPLSKVTYQELKALDFLKQNSSTDSIIFTAPFNKFYQYDGLPPVPIYTWYDTGYVSAFSGRKTLFADEEQINIMGYGIDLINKERKKVFEDKSPKNIDQFLKKYSVNYVYLVGKQNFAIPASQLNLKLIYNDGDIRIYKVNDLDVVL